MTRVWSHKSVGATAVGGFGSHEEMVEKYAEKGMEIITRPDVSQGFTLLPEPGGTGYYILIRSGRFGGDVTRVINQIAAYFNIPASKIKPQ